MFHHTIKLILFDCLSAMVFSCNDAFHKLHVGNNQTVSAIFVLSQ